MGTEYKLGWRRGIEKKILILSSFVVLYLWRKKPSYFLQDGNVWCKANICECGNSPKRCAKPLLVYSASSSLTLTFFRSPKPLFRGSIPKDCSGNIIRYCKKAEFCVEQMYNTLYLFYFACSCGYSCHSLLHYLLCVYTNEATEVKQ